MNKFQIGMHWRADHLQDQESKDKREEIDWRNDKEH
jgi:hypothetical protein